MKRWMISLVAVGVFVSTAMAITLTGNRLQGDKIIKVSMTAQTWATGAGNTAASEVAYNLNGTVVRFDVIISSVTANPTVAVTFRDQNSCIVVPDALCATLADGTNHIMLARSHKVTQDANFNPVPLCDSDITISIEPSADAGGTAQTLSVQVILYLE